MGVSPPPPAPAPLPLLFFNILRTLAFLDSPTAFPTLNLDVPRSNQAFLQLWAQWQQPYLT